MFWEEFDTTAAKYIGLRRSFDALRAVLKRASASSVFFPDVIADIESVDPNDVLAASELLASAGLFQSKDVVTCQTCNWDVAKDLAAHRPCAICGAEWPSFIARKGFAARPDSLPSTTNATVEHLESTARIAVVTALSKEGAVLEAVLDNNFPVAKGDARSKRVYQLASARALNGRHALVHLCLQSDVGNNSASVSTTDLCHDFPAVRLVIVCGIAGGCPSPANTETHVRLGDVVVSGGQGVVQFDMLKLENGKPTLRSPPRPPSQEVLNAHGRVVQEVIRSGTVMEWGIIQKQSLALGVDRARLIDVLDDSMDGSAPVRHPTDPSRREGEPRVFAGAIGSSNILLKDPQIRDWLRDVHSVRAVEMEAAGAAHAALDKNIAIFVVRGVSDYCNLAKNDDWQMYAALTASVYVIALLRNLPVLT